MTLEQFRATLSSDSSPTVAAALQALWYDARGDWDTAHEMANGVKDETGAWVHAYLHRKEGDISNADYWYRRANLQRPSGSLQEEWQDITTDLLFKS